MNISPLTYAGLRGRLLHAPGPKPDSPEIVFIYGHHSSLERWQGIAELFAQHFAVTMPDLPGFGGMESLYKRGKPATLDNLADALADFFASRYAGRQVSVVGMSLGFVIVTRMLQRHPALAKNIHLLVSLFGFASAADFKHPPKNLYHLASRTFALPVLANLYRMLFLNRFVLSNTYHRTPNAREKFKNATPAQHKEFMEFEITLWQQDDTRTYMKTSHQILTLDNTKKGRVDLPVYHIAVANDRFFDNGRVKAHYRQIFSGFHLLAEVMGGNHAPTRIKNAQEAEGMLPPRLMARLIELHK